MHNQDSFPKTSYTDSFRSQLRIAFQSEAAKPDDFTHLWTGSPDDPSDYGCEISYAGEIIIWNKVGNDWCSIEYNSKQVFFESMKMSSPTRQWTRFAPGSCSSTTTIGSESDVELVLRIIDNSPTTVFSLEPDAHPNSIFSLEGVSKTVGRLKLHLLNASLARNWRPADWVTIMDCQTLNRGNAGTRPQYQDTAMTHTSSSIEELDPRLKKFLDFETAALKAGRLDDSEIANAMMAYRGMPSRAMAADQHGIPILSVLVGDEENHNDIMPLSEMGYAVDFSNFDDINPSQQRAIHNIFDYQTSLIHAPAGCAPIRTIVSATESILRNAPETRILICSRNDENADKMDQAFSRRWHLCGFQFRHLRFPRNTTTDLQDTRVVICTYTTSGMEQLAQNWSPQVLIATEAARIRHYELVAPISAHWETLVRLVLVGDHVQLRPIYSNSAGKLIAEKSIFERMMGESWPCQILAVNYLAHSQLYYPTSSVFYGNKISSARDTLAPGPFLTGLLQKFDKGLLIRDKQNDTAKLTSFAHFIDVRDAPDVKGAHAAIDCVDVLVRALLSTQACNANQLLVCSFSNYQHLLRAKAEVNGWSEATMSNIYEVQDVSRKIVIIYLPRDENILRTSYMSRRHEVRTMMSLATDACYIVGSWRSVCTLHYTNDLQRVLFCMDETIDNFLLRLGPGPYHSLTGSVALATRNPVPPGSSTSCGSKRKRQ